MLLSNHVLCFLLYSACATYYKFKVPWFLPLLMEKPQPPNKIQVLNTCSRLINCSVNLLYQVLLKIFDFRCRNLSEYMKIAEKVKEFFHNEGIHSTTIQPEFIDYQDYPRSSADTEQTEDCVLDCPKSTPNDTCVHNTCCGPSKQVSYKLFC